MSTIDHTSTSTLGKIPIGRRISELLQERGDAFSYRAFAARIGMNRETFRLIITGERPITLPELEQVVKALGISEERLRQMDTFKKEEELKSLLNANQRTKTMMLRAQAIANEIVAVAIGYTEVGFSLNNLGRVQYLERQHDDAHQTWLSALKYAKIVQEKFDDNNLFNIVSSNLMLTYILRKEYSNVEELLTLVEQAFPNDVETKGMTYYTRMNMANHRGHLKLATEYAYRSLEYYQQTPNPRQIALSMVNVAHFEFLSGNYDKSSKMLSSTIELVKSVDSILILAVKDYVKTLIQLGDLHKAEQVIEEYESLSMDYPEYWGKMQILKTVAKGEPSHAERVIDDPRVGVRVRYFACKCLFEVYVSKGDSETAIRYYEKGCIISGSTNSFMTREEF